MTVVHALLSQRHNYYRALLTVEVIALIGLTSVKRRWRTTWGAALQGARI